MKSVPWDKEENVMAVNSSSSIVSARMVVSSANLILFILLSNAHTFRSSPVLSKILAVNTHGTIIVVCLFDAKIILNVLEYIKYK